MEAVYVNEKKYKSLGQKFKEKHSQFIDDCLNSPRYFLDLEREIIEIMRKRNQQFNQTNESIMKRADMVKMAREEEKKNIPQGMTEGEFKIYQVQKRRKGEEEEIQRKKDFINRWEIRKVKEKEVKHIRLVKQRAKLYLIHQNLLGYLKKMFDSFVQRKDLKIMQWAGRMLGKKLIYKYRAYITQYSPIMDERIQTKIRCSLRIVSNPLTRSITEKKAKDIFYQYIKDRKVKSRLKILCANYGTKLHSVFRKLESNVLRKRQRKQELLDMWDEQKLEIINILRKSKKNIKNSRIKGKLLKLPDGIRNTVTRLYLDKCENRHSIAFFKWMETQSFKTDDLIQKYILRLKKSTETEKEYYLREEEVKENQEIRHLGEEIGARKQPNLDLDEEEGKLRGDRNEELDGKSENFDYFMLDLKKDDEEDHITEFDMIGIEIAKTKKSTKNKGGFKAVKASIHNPTLATRNITDNIKGLAGRKSSKTLHSRMALVKQPSLYGTKNFGKEESYLSNPPKLIYKPSPAVMREQILRSLYIKDYDKFIIDNRVIQYKITLDDVK